MCKFIHKIGERYGKLTLTEKVRIKNHTWLVFICDCGNVIKIRDDRLSKRKDKSCGCIRKTRNRLKKIYYGMIARTTNPNTNGYENYGGRGIKVCKKWLDNFNSFYYWATKNGYKDNLTIDRINNNGCYCPENCRWITHKEQQRDKRNNRKIEYKGKTMCLSEWAEIIGVSHQMLSGRIRLGYSIEEALTIKKGKHRKKYIDKGNKEGYPIYRKSSFL